MFKAHGNMTEVEKHMNKDDLIAYKNYDQNQYSLIPGISKDKKILERSKVSTAPEDVNTSTFKHPD